jgi:16S rRNA (adenine1518-N6/adenine1519-N6)-dimethyltransferase
MTHRARKRFGQHFLHDPGVIARIVAAVRPVPGQALLEIGPGLGAITEPLLRAAGALTAVELDRDVIPDLMARCAGLGGLTVLQQDALTLDLAAVCAAWPAPTDRLRVVGNLPYNISTPLLFHLFAQKARVHDMHFMLQREVVQRMTAGPGAPDYGRLSVMVAWHCEARTLFDIGPGAFSPPPRVWSSLVRLTPRHIPPAPVADERLFAAVVNEAFTKRRKTLRNALRHRLSGEQIAACDVDPGLRPERLGVGEFARLANAVHAGQGRD